MTLAISWDDLPLTLNIAQAAEAKAVSVKTLRRLIRRHEIAHEHYGTALRFDRDALRRGDKTCNHTHTAEPQTPDFDLLKLDLLRRPSSRRGQLRPARGGIQAAASHGGRR